VELHSNNPEDDREKDISQEFDIAQGVYRSLCRVIDLDWQETGVQIQLNDLSEPATFSCSCFSPLLRNSPGLDLVEF
jgi:hypothetical protein